jgi:hypothetical protein
VRKVDQDGFISFMRRRIRIGKASVAIRTYFVDNATALPTSPQAQQQHQI